MNKWLENPWAIRLISLLLAVLLFVVVAFDEKFTDEDDGYGSIFGTSNETRTLEDIPVSTEIDSEKFVVSGVPETVKVSLQGSVSLVTATAMQRNFEVFVDLENLGVGTHIVPLEYSGVSDQLNMYIEPQEVEVSIEEKSSEEHSVSIDIINRDKIAAGFEVGNVYVDPEKVTVTSSKGIVDRIAIVKAFVDVSDFDESVTLDDVPVKVYDNQGNELNVRIDPPTVDMTVDVKSPNKNVPISLETENEVPEGIRITSMKLEQEEVQIFASEADLEQLKEIKTAPIDLSKVNESGTVEVELNLPNEVRKASANAVNVTLQVEKIEEKVLEGVTIATTSEEEDPTFIDPSSGSINVTLKGYPSDLEKITKDDLELAVEINSTTPGQYTLPIKNVTDAQVLENIEVSLELNEATIEIE
ncbi:YbbR-like domain-containing protein [Gracilibacillus marinus]|uniref:YbbR-like domain-containing protein n=1 Tax=Gracilibacillus marinus TaxID=630535 RepID=A0ABV8VSL6_9BACI